MIMFSYPLGLQIPESMSMTDDQFFNFCQANRDLRMERNLCGEISIMSDTTSETGNHNFNLKDFDLLVLILSRSYLE